MRDLANNVAAVPLIAPVVHTGNNTASAVDLQGFESAAVIVNTGAIASAGDFSIVIQESDSTSGGTFTPVAAADLVGAFPATLEAASVYKVGYIGVRRYIRTVLTKNSGTSIAAGAVVVKGDPHVRPVAA